MKQVFWQLITNEQYFKLEGLIESTVGIRLSISRKDYIENFLLKRYEELKIFDFENYYQFVCQNPDETRLLINTLSNISTHFFREPHHFKYIKDHLLPQLVTRQDKTRIWSAGCSTGEEVYSIAMLLNEAVSDIQKYDVKILGTDINTAALKIAEEGVYDESSIKNKDAHAASFEVIFENNKNHIKFNDKIKSMVRFRFLNLMEKWPIRNPFDIIFCRNVTIYLKRSVAEKLIEKFDQVLKPGGLLILGHSERLSQFQDRYISMGKTIYQKVR